MNEEEIYFDYSMVPGKELINPSMTKNQSLVS